MPIILYQLIPIAVVLLPFSVAVMLTVWWQQSLSNPWLYGALAIPVAYAVAIGVVWVSEKYELSVRGRIGGGYAEFRRDASRVNQAQLSTRTSQDRRPMFAPLSPGWFALLAAVVVLCSVALWGLTFFFRKPIG